MWIILLLRVGGGRIARLAKMGSDGAGIFRQKRKVKVGGGRRRRRAVLKNRVSGVFIRFLCLVIHTYGTGISTLPLIL